MFKVISWLIFLMISSIVLANHRNRMMEVNDEMTECMQDMNLFLTITDCEIENDEKQMNVPT